jgi:hypothetical protein
LHRECRLLVRGSGRDVRRHFASLLVHVAHRRRYCGRWRRLAGEHYCTTEYGLQRREQRLRVRQPKRKRQRQRKRRKRHFHRDGRQRHEVNLQARVRELPRSQAVCGGLDAARNAAQRSTGWDGYLSGRAVHIKKVDARPRTCLQKSQRSHRLSGGIGTLDSAGNRSGIATSLHPSGPTRCLHGAAGRRRRARSPRGAPVW